MMIWYCQDHFKLYASTAHLQQRAAMATGLLAAAGCVHRPKACSVGPKGLSRTWSSGCRSSCGPGCSTLGSCQIVLQRLKLRLLGAQGRLRSVQLSTQGRLRLVQLSAQPGGLQLSGLGALRRGFLMPGPGFLQRPAAAELDLLRLILQSQGPRQIASSISLWID